MKNPPKVTTEITTHLSMTLSQEQIEGALREWVFDHSSQFGECDNLTFEWEYLGYTTAVSCICVISGVATETPP